VMPTLTQLALARISRFLIVHDQKAAGYNFLRPQCVLR
jgi:hypothetical protein